MGIRWRLWTLVMGLCLLGNAALAQTTIILQYKHVVQYHSPNGLPKGEGYLLVETDENGLYAATTPVLVAVDKAAKTFSSGNWALAFRHDAARGLVTANTSTAVLHGAAKVIEFKGKYGGFTPFSFSLATVALAMQGAECDYVATDSWYATRKSTLKLDQARTVHMIGEGDDSMAAALAHLKRYLEDLGYTEIL